MRSNLIEIFVGSDIETNYIASLLIENQIQCFVQNQLEGSLSAGWVNGSAYNSSVIRVDIYDAEKARSIIREYLKTKSSE